MNRKKYLTILITVIIIGFTLFLSWNYYCKQVIYKNIDLLKSSDVYQQEEAISNLAKTGKPAVEPLIFAMKYDAVHAESQVMKFADKILKKKTLKKNAADLKEESKNLKSGAARALGLIGDPAAIDPLVSLLHYGDKETEFIICENAVIALGKIGKKAIPALAEAAKSSDYQVRFQAVRALGLTKDPDAIEPLINAIELYFEKGDPELKYSQDFMGAAFAEAMGNLGKPAVKALTGELKSKDISIRYFSIKALGNTKDPDAIKPLIEILNGNYPFLWDSAGESLKEIGEPAAPALIKTLSNEEITVKLIVIEALGDIKSPAAVKPLTGFLENPNPHIRLETIFALSKYQSERFIPAFINCLQDDSPIVRKAASTALSEMGETAVLPLLGELKSGDTKRYDLAFVALMNMTDLKSVEILKKELKSADPEYRGDIESIIVKITANDKSPEFQIKFLKDENVLIRRNAAYRLGVFNNSEAVLPLITALKDKDQEVRENSITSLGLIGDARAVEPLMALLKNKNKKVVGAASSALRNIGGEAAPYLIKALRSGDAGYRLGAYNALENTSDNEVLHQLAEAYNNDKDANFRLEMVELIESSVINPGMEILKEPLNDNDWRIRESALECLLRFPYDDYTDVVLAKLDDHNDEVKISAIRALGVWQNHSAIPHLIKAFNTKNWKVRLAVVNALREFRDINTGDTFLKALKDERKEIRKSAFAYIISDSNSYRREEIIAALKKDPEFAIGFFKRLQSMEIEIDDKAIAKELEKNGNIDKALICLYSNNAVLVQAAKKWCKKHGYKTEMNLKVQLEQPEPNEEPDK